MMNPENICQPSGSVVEQNVIDFLAHRKSATKFIHGNTYEVEERSTEVAHYPRMQPPPGKRSFLCTSCGQSFLDYADLEIHSRVCEKIEVTTKKTFSCSLCGNIYENLNHLEIHMKVQHLDHHTGTYSERVKDIRYNEYVRSTTQPANFIVEVVSTSVVNNDNVINDIDNNKIVTVIDAPQEEIEKGGKLYKCSVCGLSNDVTANLYKHMKSNHPDFRIVHKRAISKKMKEEKSQSIKSRRQQNSEDFTTERMASQRMDDYRQMSEECAKDLIGEDFDLSDNAPEIPLYKCSVCDKKFFDETECSNHFKTHKGKSLWDYSALCQNNRNINENHGNKKTVKDLIKHSNEQPLQVNQDTEPKEMHTVLEIENSLSFVPESDKAFSCNESTPVNDESSDKIHPDKNLQDSVIFSDHDDEDSFEDDFSNHVEQTLKTIAKSMEPGNTEENTVESYSENNEQSLDISKGPEYDKSQEKLDSLIAAKDSGDGISIDKLHTTQSNQNPSYPDMVKHNRVSVLSILKPVTNTLQSHGVKSVHMDNAFENHSNIGQEVVTGTKKGKSGNSISESTKSNIVQVVDISPIGKHRYKCSACDVTSRSTSNLYFHMKSAHKNLKVVKRRSVLGERGGVCSSDDQNGGDFDNDNHGKGAIDYQIASQGVEKRAKIPKLDPETSLNEDPELAVSFYDIDGTGKSRNSDGTKTVRIIANPNAIDGNKYMCSRCFLSSPDTDKLYQHMETAHKDLTVIQVRKKIENSRHKEKIVQVIDIPSEGTHRYKCSACIRTSSSSGNLYDHMRRVHKGYKIILRRGADDDNESKEIDVNYEVDEEADDLIHVIDVPTPDGNLLYKCSECHLICKEVSNMYKHMRRKHAGMKIAQRIRKKKRSAIELAQCKNRKYYVSKKDGDRFTGDCENDFHKARRDTRDSENDFHKAKRDNHLLSVIDNFDNDLGCRQYTCSKCNKSFSDTSSAHKHMATVHRGKKFIHEIKMSNGKTITQRASTRRSVLEKTKSKSDFLSISDNDDGNSGIENSESDPEWMDNISRSRSGRQLRRIKCGADYSDTHSVSNTVKKTHKADLVAQRKKGRVLKPKSKKRQGKSKYLSEDSEDLVSDEDLGEKTKKGKDVDSSDMPFTTDGAESNGECGGDEGDVNMSVECSDTVHIMEARPKKGHRFKCLKCNVICGSASNLKKHMKQMHTDAKIMDKNPRKNSKLSELSRKDEDFFSENDSGLLMIVHSGGSNEESHDITNRNESEYSHTSPNSDVVGGNVHEEESEGAKKIQVKGVTMFKMIPSANKNSSQTIEDEVDEFENISNVFQSKKRVPVFEKAQKRRNVFNHSESDVGSDDENTVRVIDIAETKGGHKFKCSKCDAVSRDTSNLNKHMRRMHKDLRIVYRKRGRKFTGKSLKRSKKTENSFEENFPDKSETDDFSRDKSGQYDKTRQGKDFWEYSFTNAYNDVDSFAEENSEGEIEMRVKDAFSSKSIVTSPSLRKRDTHAQDSHGNGSQGKISETVFIEQERNTYQDDIWMEENVVRAIDISLPDGTCLFKCSKCGLTCRNSSNLYKHIKRMHSEMRLIQKQPNRRTVMDKSELSAKYLDSDDENESSDTVRAIEITPTKQGHRFKCSRCDLICRDSSNMTKHMQRMHRGMRILPRKRGRKVQSLQKSKKDVHLKDAECEGVFENESTIPAPEQNFWDYLRGSVIENSKEDITRENKVCKLQRNGVTTLEPVTPEKISSQVTEEKDTVLLLTEDRKFEVVISGSLNAEVVLTPDDFNAIRAGTSNMNVRTSLNDISTLGGDSVLVNSSKAIHEQDSCDSLHVIDLPMRGGLTKYKCSKCDLICNKLSNIYKHMRRMHPDLTMTPRPRKNKAWYA